MRTWFLKSKKENKETGYCIPDFIVRYIPDLLVPGAVKVGLVKVEEHPTPEQLKRGGVDYKNDPSFIKLCPLLKDITSVQTKEWVFKHQDTTMIMKIHLDDNRKWVKESWTGDEIKDMAKRAAAKGYTLLCGKPKWFLSGILLYAKSDLIAEAYVKFREVDPTRMDGRKFVKNTAGLFGEVEYFDKDLIIKVTPSKWDGYCLMNSEILPQLGLKVGDKLGGSAKCIVKESTIRIADADIIMPEDAIKHDDYLGKPELIARYLGRVPSQAAEKRSSTILRRKQKGSLMWFQWFYRHLMGFLDRNPTFNSGMGHVKRVVEGNPTEDDIRFISEYLDKDTKEADVPKWAHFVINGCPVEMDNATDREKTPIYRNVMTSASTAMLRLFCFPVAGGYRVAMPTRYETVKRLLLRYPFVLPVWGPSDLKDINVIGVDSDLMTKVFAGDWDGDEAHWIEECLLRMMQLPDTTFPDWTKKDDKDWLLANLHYPEKSTVKDPRTAVEAIADSVDAQMLIGTATNMCMIVLDALRVKTYQQQQHAFANISYTDEQKARIVAAGNRNLQAVYLNMASTVIQKYVDALKYVPEGMKAPELMDKTVDGVVIPGLATRYGADDILAKLIQSHYKAATKMDFMAMSNLMDDDRLDGSFYYAITRKFHSWKPVSSVNMQAIAEDILKVYPCSPTLNKERTSSFSHWGKDVDARMNQMLLMITGKRDEQIALLAKCWYGDPELGRRPDTSLARALEKWMGIRLIDIWRNVFKKTTQAAQ